MTRDDFTKLIGIHDERNLMPGGAAETDYLPVACLLTTGQGVVGYFNAQLNDDLAHAFVLLNTRLVDFRRDDSVSRGAAVSDFNDFLEQVVTRLYASHDDDGSPRSLPSARAWTCQASTASRSRWRRSPCTRSRWFTRWHGSGG